MKQSHSNPASAGAAEFPPRPWVRALRWVVLAGTLCWAALVMTHFRTYGYGFHPMVLLAFAVYGLPAVVLCGYRRRLASWVRRVAVISVLALFVAEAWAGTEELLWRREAPESETPPTHYPLHALQLGGDPFDSKLKTISKQRWWPYGHHTLWYNPESGRFGGHD